MYEFVQTSAHISPDGTPIGNSGNILAILELNGQSVLNDIANIVRFSFTKQGNALFGFGTGDYVGTFDLGASQFSPPRFVISDGNGGLDTTSGKGTQADWVDLDPLASSQFTNISEFHLQFGEIDQLILVGSTSLVADGHFILADSWKIPEPSSISLLVIGLAGISRVFSKGRIRARVGCADEGSASFEIDMNPTHHDGLSPRVHSRSKLVFHGQSCRKERKAPLDRKNRFVAFGLRLYPATAAFPDGSGSRSSRKPREPQYVIDRTLKNKGYFSQTGWIS